MATENNQKIKLLKLWELLRQETDEDHPMRTSDICQRLRAMNTSCDPRTLHKDMKMLNDEGFEVMTERIGHESAFYVSDRSFSVPELKILIDAVQASSFVTPKKTAQMIEKIAQLGGSHRAEILKNNIVRFNTRKHSNEAIYYSVEYLEEAVAQDKKVLFLYFDLDEKGRKIYRRDGHHYVAEPVGLVFLEDNYYFVGYSSRHDSLTTYRVDRMQDVKILDDEISEMARQHRQSLSRITESTFKMFGGQSTDVLLEFDRSLIGAVYDKFGENILMRRNSEDTCTVTVNVQVSPTFFGWVFQFGKLMRILGPASVQEEYQKRIEELL